MKCPHCKGGIPIKEDGHYHCLTCGRDSFVRLIPVRGEARRLELVNGSRAFDPPVGGWAAIRRGVVLLPGQRR